jgi:peptidoglycan/LPS O-acetylase OafA/YrhL
MPHSPPPPDSIIVPNDPAREARTAGAVVIAGSLGILLGLRLPWGIYRIGSAAIHLSIVYALIMLVIGMMALIAGITMWRKAARDARLLARLSGFAASGIGAYELSYTTTTGFPGPGVYLFCVGALLVVVGSFLQRAAPAPRRAG